MNYKCVCGNIGYISYSELKSNRKEKNKCKKCSSAWNKTNYNEIYSFFEKNNCELLEKKFINTHTKMKYRCFCGNISYITFNDFRYGHRCMNCGSKERSGEKNGKWNSEMTDEDRKEASQWMKTNEHKIWVKSVLKRDKYICQICDEHKNHLNAHHILNWRTHKDLRIDINNGITLCEDCHKEFHMKYGKKNNNLEQIAKSKAEVQYECR